MFRGPLRGSKHSRVANIYSKSSIFPPVLGPTHQSPSRTSPDWVIGPRFAAPRRRKKTRRLRMVISMLSHRVVLMAFANEGVVWPVCCRLWKLITCRRTWCCADWNVDKCFSLSVHVTHPYSRVSSTPTFLKRTFTLSGAVVISYHPGPNCLRHAHMTHPSFGFEEQGHRLRG